MRRITLACAFLFVLFSVPAFACTTISVHQSDDLQSKINSAQPCDTVELDAGATFTGSFILPNKNSTIDITIQSSEASLLPAGKRVQPSDKPHMATIVSLGLDQPALKTDRGASHYKIIGIEFTFPDLDNIAMNEIVSFGRADETNEADSPSNLILDRCYVHGWPTRGVQRGIGLNSKATAITNCYISDIHKSDVEAQGIGGWNGRGPFDIINNYVEAAGQNIFFGGARPSIQGLVPANITVKRNYLFKPLSWHHAGAPFCQPTGSPPIDDWVIKNIFELKSAIHVTVDGNVMENNWGCRGYGAINLTVRNDSGEWATIQDVTISNNVVRHAQLGINILGLDSDGSSVQGHGITISNNLFDDVNSSWGDEGRWVRINSMNDVILDHNTAFLNNKSAITFDGPSNNSKMTGFRMTNNIINYGEFGINGAVPPKTGTTHIGEVAIVEYFNPSLPPIDHNVIIGGDQSLYPHYSFPINFWPLSIPNVRFVSESQEYRLASNSPYKGMASDGKDVGVDFAALETATGLPTAPSNLIADSNGVPDRKLNWVDNSTNEDGFKIEMRVGGPDGVWGQFATVGPGVNNFPINTIKCLSRDIDFRVRAFNSAGDSAYSNESFACYSYHKLSSMAEGVVWTNVYGSTTSGNNLYKATQSYAWDAGAVSTRSIASGDGYVEITPGDAGTYRMFGLSNGDSGPVYTDIDFALSLGEGTLAVYEGGVYRGTVGTYAAGDRLRVAVEDGVVKYYKNDATLLYTSTVAPTYPLLLDTSISTSWGNVTNAKIAGSNIQGPITQPVVWTNINGCTASGNNLYKANQSYYWDAGAVSSKAIASGDGYVEITPSDDGTYRMFGLGNGDTSPAFSDIEFALSLGESSLAVYESGVFRGQVGTYVAGDKLRVAVEGGVVKYYKNGTLLYTSTVAPTYPLLLDTSISTSWGNVTNAYISGTLTP